MKDHPEKKKIRIETSRQRETNNYWATQRPPSAKHKKTSTEIGSKLYKICNIYSKIKSPKAVLEKQSIPLFPQSPRSTGKILPVHIPGISSFQAKLMKVGKRVKSPKIPVSEAVQQSKQITVNIEPLAQKKIQLRLPRSFGRGTAKTGTSAHSMRHQSSEIFKLGFSSNHSGSQYEDLCSQTQSGLWNSALNKVETVRDKQKIYFPKDQVRPLSEIGEYQNKKILQHVAPFATPLKSTREKKQQNSIKTKRDFPLALKKTASSKGASGVSPISPRNSCLRDLISKISNKHMHTEKPFYLERKTNKLESEKQNLIKSIKEYKKKEKTYPQTTLDFYYVGRVLGKGAYGKVNLGLHKLSGKLIAMKSLHKQYLESERNKAKFQNEIALLRELRHPNVIRLYETFTSDNLQLMIIELCAGGDLLSYVRKRKRLSEPVAKAAFKQILDGLQCCHSKNVAHRDIKLDNILLSECGDIKICDFGVSKRVSPGQLLSDRCGTPAYIAPEIIKDLSYNGCIADIWSAGVVLYAMLYGNFPFKAESVEEIEKLILRGQYALGNDITPEARHLLCRLLSQEPGLRPSISEILADPWMHDMDPELRLFGDEEIETIREEFNFQNKLKKKEESESSIFTEYNLETTEGDNEAGLDLSKSTILAPFNTLEAEERKLINSVRGLCISKKKVLKLGSKLREFDRKYERENNSQQDNGVYVQAGKNSQPTIAVPSIPSPEPRCSRTARGPTAVSTSSSITSVSPDPKVLRQMEFLGFDRPYVLTSLHNNELNCATTCYYLLCEH